MASSLHQQSTNGEATLSHSYGSTNQSRSSAVLNGFLNTLERFVVWAFYPDASKPLQFLQGNFSPVPEQKKPTPYLPVIGTIPSCLNGEFVRIGPNPKHKPTAGYHWFDGDGMMHGLKIKDGKAVYVCRYVETSRLKQEDHYGASKFLKMGDMKGFFGYMVGLIFTLRCKFEVLDVSQGMSVANTAMVYHDGRVLALNEGDKPYAIRVLEDGDLQTVGLMDYEKRLTHPFTAHPKVDPVTGELFTFGYQFQAPYCTYRVVSKEGVMQDEVSITVSGPILMHDFAITEHYAIFMDFPLYFDPKALFKGNSIFKFDDSKPARIGILPRYARNESMIKWFELPTCYVFHNVNAWEEGNDDVVLYSCRIPKFDLESAGGVVKERVELPVNELYEMRFNMKTGEALQKQLSLAAVDFPRINEKYTGRKQQFAYCTMLENLKINGLVKFNLWREPELKGKEKIEVGGNVEGVILFGPGRYGSEAVFIPRSSNRMDEDEDDGYLICFVHDETTGSSMAHIYDAKTMASEPVGIIQIPHRVPYGFHAFFVSEEQLQSQR